MSHPECRTEPALKNYKLRYRWWRSEDEIWTGTSSNRQTEIVKNSGRQRRGWCDINGAACQEFWGLEWSWTRSHISGLAYTTVHLSRSDSGWSWTFWIGRAILYDREVAPITSQSAARFFFFAIYLNIFPLEFWPRTFAIEFHAKKCTRSGNMVLESHVAIDHLIFCHALHDKISWTLNPPTSTPFVCTAATLAQLLQVLFSLPLLAAGFSVFCRLCQNFPSNMQQTGLGMLDRGRLNMQRQKKTRG